MIKYTSREISKLVKQYEMFASSLNFISENHEKEQICSQMTKIKQEIIDSTNEIYEEEYAILNNNDTLLLEDEKDRLQKLLELIKERKKYLQTEINDHQDRTDISINYPFILGEDKLVEYKKRINIVEKYQSNKLRITKLNQEVNVLDKKITEIINKIKYNNSLNDKLEKEMISFLDKSFKDLNLYILKEKENEIISIYNQLEFAYKTAKENMKLAKEKKDDKFIIECDNSLSQVSIEYGKYREQKLMLDLMSIFEREVTDYEELKEKRKKIDLILEELKGTELYNLVNEELNKQYNTIKIEEQDIKTYRNLAKEKEVRINELYQLETENNSSEYTQLLKPLLENEKKNQEKVLAEQKKLEYEERQRKLFEEKKTEAERLKRQILIDEARKKEQEKRTKELLEQQKNSVINSPKINFEVPKEIVRENPVVIDDIKPLMVAREGAIPVIKNVNLEPQIIEEVIPRGNDIKEEENIFPEFKEEEIVFPKEDNKKPVLEGNTNLRYKGWFN